MKPIVKILLWIIATPFILIGIPVVASVAFFVLSGALSYLIGAVLLIIGSWFVSAILAFFGVGKTNE